ncbi:MAG: hypothetical protein OXD43_14170 [Bacteroidetes bacterium]|nr:hypothetical protein [Bacteroidota bacterium]
MTQLLDTPSSSASVSELADHAELMCWRYTRLPLLQLARNLGRLEENDYTHDGVPEEDPLTETVEDVLTEIYRREKACRDGYPFEIRNDGHTLVAVQPEKCHKLLLYRYFLLATRLNMKTSRRHAQMDGADLFEEVAADIVRSYFGCRAEARVFGTASGIPSFEKRVNWLCKEMGLKYYFRNRDNARTVARDGKLDVVVWKKFADERDSMLIGFGQCKTGTSFRNNITELDTSVFCSKWLDTSPAVMPVRLFLVTEVVSNRWYTTASDAGLLFDRCRLIDYADDISEEVLSKVKAWTKAAAHVSTLPES